MTGGRVGFASPPRIGLMGEDRTNGTSRTNIPQGKVVILRSGSDEVSRIMTEGYGILRASPSE